MNLLKTLTQHPNIPIFGRIEGLESDCDDQDDLFLEPIESDVLRESEISWFFIVKAKHILPDRTIRDCYIDVCLPERISDYAYFVSEGEIKKGYHHEFDGDIICAVPIDCFGVYELFYSKILPDIGIEILKRGLAVSESKRYIAEDLGYILRDEERFAEAAEMFQISVDHEPSNYFIYGELAACYEEIGELDKAGRYRDLFQNPP